MEAVKKKTIMLGVIVTCLVLAGIITYATRAKSSGIEALKGQLIWVKCSNSDCGAEYQMDKKEYFDTIQKLTKENPFAAISQGTLALICKKCGEESVYRAEKCPKCGLVFFWSTAGHGDLADRCPECGNSQTEETRKQARGETRQGE